MARRVRRRKTSYSISKTFKRYALGFMFLSLAGAIVGLISYVTGVVPATDLHIGSVNISNTLFLNIIGWAGGIVLVLHGLRYFGIKL